MSAIMSKCSAVLRSSPLLSLSKPFTPQSLKALRCALSAAQQLEPQLSQPRNNAGVLIPLCNVEGRPGVLFQVRAKSLRSHSGEVR